MYFSVEVDEASHLWRQRFPNGRPEQLTFGPTEEDGVAVAPDGSLVTSIGMAQSAIWVRDSRGERPLSSEGDVMGRLGSYSLPSFTRDGTKLYYLRRESPRAAPELWRSELASLASEPLLPGVGMTEYDVTDDGRRVVYTAQPSGKPSELWIAALDGSAPPIQLTAGGENSPHFGPKGEVLFRFTDGRFNYLGRINADGSARAKVADYPIGTVQAISPDRRWITVLQPQGSASIVGSMAIPTRGGTARLICPDPCYGRWTPDGKVMYVQLREGTSSSPGQMIAMPVVPETGLPDLPPAGIQPTTPVADVRGSWLVSRMDVVPGRDPETYTYIEDDGAPEPVSPACAVMTSPGHCGRVPCLFRRPAEYQVHASDEACRARGSRSPRRRSRRSRRSVRGA